MGKCFVFMLTLFQMTDFGLSKEFTDEKFKLDENDRKLSKQVENTVGSGEIARYERFLLFPVFLKDLYCRHVKTIFCGQF